MSARNPYELAARAKKVTALLAAIPANVTADELARAKPCWRDNFAATIGVHSPSDETWADLVKAVRMRDAQPLLLRFLTESTDRSIVIVPLGQRVECVLSWGRSSTVATGDSAEEAIAKALDTWSRAVDRMRTTVREMCTVVGVEPSRSVAPRAPEERR